MGPVTASTPPAPILSTQTRVLTRASLKAYGIPFSNPTLLRLERRGEFPKRFFLTPKTPAWTMDDITAWIATRQTVTESHRTAAATEAAKAPPSQARRRCTRARKTVEAQHARATGSV